MTDMPAATDGKPDPRRKDIGFDKWMGYRATHTTILTNGRDNMLLYSAEQMREAWIAGAESVAVSEIEHKPGCPALGGYGTADRECICKPAPVCVAVTPRDLALAKQGMPMTYDKVVDLALALQGVILRIESER